MRRTDKIRPIVAGFLVILTLIPALYPLDDDLLRDDSPFNRAYSQLFAATVAFHDLGLHFFWTRTLSAVETAFTLPNDLPSSAETRAPPA